MKTTLSFITFDDFYFTNLLDPKGIQIVKSNVIEVSNYDERFAFRDLLVWKTVIFSLTWTDEMVY